MSFKVGDRVKVTGELLGLRRESEFIIKEIGGDRCTMYQVKDDGTLTTYWFGQLTKNLTLTTKVKVIKFCSLED